MARLSPPIPGWKARTLLLTVSVFFYLAWTGLAATRQLWHDELFTYYIATAPSLSRLWQELNLDLNPPLNYLVVRAAVKLFGTAELAVRLPSILAFLGASVCLYAFVARWLGSLYGMLAALGLWATPFFYYAVEARSYALILLLFGVAMVGWQRAMEPDRPWWAVPLLAVSVAAMAVTHLFVVFYVFPFGLAELYRTVRNRRIDWGVWAALIAPLVLPVLFVKIVAHYQEGAVSWPFQASFSRLALFFRESVSPEGPAYLLCLAISLLLFAGRARDGRPRVSGQMLALCFGLVALPVVMTAALRLIHGGFFDRYSIPTAFGYAAILATLVALSTHRSERAAFWCCWILLAYLFLQNPIVQTASSCIRGKHRAYLALERGKLVNYEPEMQNLGKIDPDLPIVDASGLTFLEMDHYEPLPTVERLYYLTDRTLALRYAHALLFEGFNEDKKYFPIRAHVAPYREFVAQHRKFLVFGTPDYIEDWLIPVLLHENARLRYLGDFEGPYKDCQLFEVDMD